MNLAEKRAHIKKMISEANRRISELERSKCRLLKKITTSDEVEKEKERLTAIKNRLDKSLSHYEAKQTIGEAVKSLISHTLDVRIDLVGPACGRCGIDEAEEYLPDKFRKHIIVAAIYAINEKYPIERQAPYREGMNKLGDIYKSIYRERAVRAIEELKLLLFLP